MPAFSSPSAPASGRSPPSSRRPFSGLTIRYVAGPPAAPRDGPAALGGLAPNHRAPRVAHRIRFPITSNRRWCGRMTGSPLSKSQVNKAGRVLRKAFGESSTLDERVPWALDVLVAWRAAHQYPLTKSNNGLRSMVRTEGCQVEVSQRLKRVPTIIDKLERHPTMQLATMQDIAGCRAVLASIQELHRVQRRLSKNRPPVHVDDYISQPRASGYRGVHVMVQYDGRTIEVQLRTQVMHSWPRGRLRGDGD